jgi:hypothetical protein
VANSQVTIYQWDDAILVSDVRGLPQKTPVTFGLKTKNPLEKAVNLLTGARVTTISKPAQLAMAQERMGVLGKERFGGRDMSIFYVPEKELERMRLTDPAKYQEALKFKELQRVINKRRRDLREAAK